MLSYILSMFRVIMDSIICFLQLKTLYNNHRNICCAKWSKGVTYKRVPVILEEHDLKDYKNYVY